MVTDHRNTVKKCKKSSLYNLMKTPNHNPKIFILPDICWQNDRAGHKQSRRAMEGVRKKP